MKKPRKPVTPVIATIARIPPEIHERVRTIAEQENRSFNAQLIVLLKDALNRTRIKKES